jgi:hypothetical protein
MRLLHQFLVKLYLKTSCGKGLNHHFSFVRLNAVDELMDGMAV